MLPFRHKLANSVLLMPGSSPAAGNKVNPDDLPVLTGRIGDLPVVQSHWKPTAAELAILNRNGCVAVTLLGTTHAPMRLEAIETEVPEIPQPDIIGRSGGITIHEVKVEKSSGTDEPVFKISGLI